MTTKKKILRMVEKLDEEVSYDRVIYHLMVMRDIEIGLEQAERGEVIDHDALMAQLDAEDAQDYTHLVGTGKKRPTKHKKNNRPAQPPDRHRVHAPAQARPRNPKKVS